MMRPLSFVDQRGGSALTWLTLAVFVLLMAFFAVLNASTLPDPQRTKQALNSVSSAFGVDPLPLPAMLAEGPSSRDGTGEGEGYPLLTRMLADVNDPLMSVAKSRDGTLSFSVPKSQFTETQPRPRWVDVVTRWLRDDAAGGGAQIDLVFSATTDPQAMGVIAAAMTRFDVPANRLSIGTQIGSGPVPEDRFWVMIRPMRDYNQARLHEVQ